MLKWSSENDINEFCAKICSLFNPKFHGTVAEQNAQSEIAFATVYSFAKKCELTAAEFELAFHLATEGKLKSELDKDGNAEIIKLYRDIDIIKLGEIKSSYIRFKNTDPKYNLGKYKIEAFLKPPSVELTPEQKKESFEKFLKEEYSRLQSKGYVLGSTIFYDLIRPNYKVVNLKFVENFFLRFKPEVFEEEKRSVEFHLASSKKVVKKDVFLSFKELFIEKYIEKAQLKSLSESDWIEHWQNIKKESNEH